MDIYEVARAYDESGTIPRPTFELGLLLAKEIDRAESTPDTLHRLYQALGAEDARLRAKRATAAR